MGKHAILVMGPAGAGKSTFCSVVQRHCEVSHRRVHALNLDPAADHFDYEVSIDVRELVSLDSVMEELEFGPNGGLMFCFEYLLENTDWLADQIGDYDDDYLLIDCPGQIEIFSHVNVMRRFVDQLRTWGYSVCGVWLLDSHFVTDPGKFISGSLACLSAMVQLEIPHVNLLSKCDLLKKEKNGQGWENLQKFLDGDIESLIEELPDIGNSRLNKAIGGLLADYSMVSFLPLDSTEETSVEAVMMYIDQCTQYGEDMEPKAPEDDQDLPDVQEESQGIGGADEGGWAEY